MSITIRNLKRRPGGRESIRERDFDEDEITIGRDAGSDITINDLAISLKHAKLKIGADGLAVLDLLGRHSAMVGKRIVSGRAAGLKPGAIIKLGRFELRIEEPRGPGNVTATLEQVEAVEAGISGEDEAAVFGLGRALPPKRLLSWVLLLGILGFFLALPILGHKNPDSKIVKSIPVQSDISWLSGPINMMHVNLKDDCKTCHVKAFVSVKDEACAACHTGLKNHARPVDMDATRPTPSGFGAQLDKVSNVFGRDPARCSSCHVEHNKRHAIIPMNQKMCADCHRDLKTNMPETTLLNVSDFGNDHPEFRPTVITAPHPTKPKTTRVSLADNPKGFSGLKFPHDIHLRKGKAVARMASTLPRNYTFKDGVDCADCHRPEAGGALFEPISMVQDCAMCHDLAFEDDGGYLRTLRHGEPNEVIATMRDFYLAKALANIRDVEMNSRTRRRPGSAQRIRDLNRREIAFAQADERTAAKVLSIFSKGGACFDCHVIDNPVDLASLDYRVRPISVNDVFYTKSPFNHESHDIGDMTCQSCHAAKTSKQSSDVLLPKIDKCRECHVGEDSYASGGKMAQGTLPSTCLTCHTYHDGPHAELMGAAQNGETQR